MIEKFSALLQDFRNEHFLEAYHRLQAEAEGEMINIFKVVSDTYYKENFHSDILAFLLMPYRSSEKGFRYLSKFIDYVNTFLSKEIDSSNYKTYEVKREPGRIDVLVLGKSGKTKVRHSIVIENKINNAKDMDDQLPRYFHVAQEFSQVDAIVYLTKNELKNPNESTWTSVRPEEFRQKVTVIRACTGKKTDLIRGWLSGLLEDSTDSRYSLIVEQYINTIQHLGGLVMPYENMVHFYEFVKEGDNFETAQTLSKYIQELIRYRSNLVYEKLLGLSQKGDCPFDRFSVEPNYGFPYFQGLKVLPKEDIKLLLIPEEARYKIEFYNQAVDKGNKPLVDVILKRIERLKDFEIDEERYVKYFDFPAKEEGFFSYVRDLLKAVAEIKAL
ncbi:MAG: PD-(D/E)XK nuclease family protein [Spirochaetia bacterium]|jgi:hypothetical protein